MDNSWKKYYEKTKGQGPRPLLMEAMSYVDFRNEALDLGSSALNDVRYLLSENFQHVTAVDKEPVAFEVVSEFLSNRFSYIISHFEDFVFPQEKYDLVNAQYSLPFIAPEVFNRVFIKMKNSIVKNGIFVGQLFGERDERNTSSRRMIFFKKTDVEQLFSDMRVIKFLEEEKDDYTTLSSKPLHLHIFNIIAKKI